MNQVQLSERGKGLFSSLWLVPKGMGCPSAPVISWRCVRMVGTRQLTSQEQKWKSPILLCHLRLGLPSRFFPRGLSPNPYRHSHTCHTLWISHHPWFYGTNIINWNQIQVRIQEYYVCGIALSRAETWTLRGTYEMHIGLHSTAAQNNFSAPAYFGCWLQPSSEI